MKYKYAKQWGIHCVVAKWFHDSVEAGYCLPEEGYDVDSEGGEGGEGGGPSESGEDTNRANRKRYCCVMNHDIVHKEM